MRTGGNLNGYMDITLKRRVEAGEVAGPAIDATMPYVNGPSQFVQMTALQSEGRARQHVSYWADEGATSVKAYMQISRAALGTAVREAHARGMKVTGHLCSVTYSEAAILGIDNLEHGFFAATDFVPDKTARRLPRSGPRPAGHRRPRSQRPAVPDAGEDPDRAPGRRDLHAHRLRAQHPGPAPAARARRPGAAAARAVPAEPGPGRGQHAVDLPAAVPQGDGARARVRARRRAAPRRHRPDRRRRRHSRVCQPPAAGAARRGGVHAARGDPDRHPNGARYLGRDARIGALAPGKQADLVVVDGDPSTAIADVRKVEWCSSKASASTPRSSWRRSVAGSGCGDGDRGPGPGTERAC